MLSVNCVCIFTIFGTLKVCLWMRTFELFFMKQQSFRNFFAYTRCYFPVANSESVIYLLFPEKLHLVDAASTDTNWKLHTWSGCNRLWPCWPCSCCRVSQTRVERWTHWPWSSFYKQLWCLAGWIYRYRYPWFPLSVCSIIWFQSLKATNYQISFRSWTWRMHRTFLERYSCIPWWWCWSHPHRSCIWQSSSWFTSWRVVKKVIILVLIVSKFQ